MSDPLDLEALRKLSEEATPGPWRADDVKTNINSEDGDDEWWNVESMALGYFTISEASGREEDARFIAAARSALPQLIAENERLREALRSLADAVQPLEDRHDEASIACPPPRDGAPGCSVCGLMTPLAAARRALREETGP